MTSNKFDQAAAQIGRDFGYQIKGSYASYLAYATVTKVDEEKMTFDAITGEDQLFRDMELNVIPSGGSSVILVPEVDSVVILGFSEGMVEQPFLAQTTKVSRIIIANKQSEDSTVNINEDTIAIKRGTTTCTIEKDAVYLDADLIQMNGGENGGLVLVEKITQSLNNLVNEFKSFITEYNSHTHTAPMGATTPPITTSTLQPKDFNKDDYENTKITQ